MDNEFLLQDIATLTNASLLGDPKLLISGISDLESAQESDISFLSNPKYAKLIASSKAGAIFVPPHLEPVANKNFLVVENPSRAFQEIAELLLKNRMRSTAFQGIHETAVIHPQAKLGKDVSIGPYAVIDADVVIENDVVIGSGCYIGLGCKIGPSSKLHANVTLREGSILGARVIIQPGAVIGSCGFGYNTNNLGQHEKINQIGIVVIEDDVEIGANSTIDRARFKETRIGKGTKIDNLVMLAHGVQMGENNLLLAQVGIAGSTTVGNNVIMAGQVGVVGHISIGDNVIVTAQTGISKPISEKGVYSSGMPAMAAADFNRMAAHMRRIETYVDKIKDLESRLSQLEEKK